MPWKLHYFGEPLSETLHLPNKKVLSFVDAGEISFESLSIRFFPKNMCSTFTLFIFLKLLCNGFYSVFYQSQSFLIKSIIFGILFSISVIAASTF